MYPTKASRVSTSEERAKDKDDFWTLVMRDGMSHVRGGHKNVSNANTAHTRDR